MSQRKLTDEHQGALRPLASLAGKSEKALRKLAPGTWQHAMLRDNLDALRLASALILAEPGRSSPGRGDLQKALRAFESMIGRTESLWGRFAAGSARHTLQKNRLQALRLAEKLIKGELERR